MLEPPLRKEAAAGLYMFAELETEFLFGSTRANTRCCPCSFAIPARAATKTIVTTNFLSDIRRVIIISFFAPSFDAVQPPATTETQSDYSLRLRAGAVTNFELNYSDFSRW